MKFIGITGGVGAGKSAILSYLAEKTRTRVMLADEIAHELMEPGTDCYEQIVKAFEAKKAASVCAISFMPSAMKVPNAPGFEYCFGKFRVCGATLSKTPDFVS